LNPSVNQQHLLDPLQHLSYGIESSSSAVEGEKILNINELASRLNVSEEKLSRLLASKNMTAEQVDNPAKEAQISRELNSGITPSPSTPTKAPQAPGGGLAKASAPAQGAGLVTQGGNKSASQVKQAQQDVAFEMFATPVRSTTYVMERGLEIARKSMDDLDEQDAQEVAKDILEARKKSVGELRASSAAWSGRVTAASMATFNMDDMGATIEVSAMP
jgi:hypothetical protein